MKFIYLLLTAYFCAPILAQDKVTNYVDKYKLIAIAEMERSGVPASIKMAQGILESGIGDSELAATANNHFGIKCGGDWNGGSHYVWDDEVAKSCFRVYLSAEESYIAHTEFLLNPVKKLRYGFLFELKKDDYKSWAKGLQSSGYATSKTYSEKLISLIERYELYKLDHLTLKSSEITELEAQKILAWQNISIQDSTNLEHKIDTNQFHKLDTFNAAPAFPLHQLSLWEKWHNNSTDKSINSLQIFVVNGSKTVILQQGQTLNALAQQLKIKKSKLIKYNELQKNQLQSFQHLFIEPKSKKYTGQTSSHKVVFHENLYDISQLYGIKLKNLQQLNTAFRKRKISEGDNIKLKK